jgi:predicted nucleic acid-binding protein
MIMVPALWAVELANALLVGERRRRLRQSDILEFAELVGQLSLVQDTPAAGKQMGNVLATARQYDLTAYDAAYLELSIRERAELATFDVKLQKAARKAGVLIFASKSL